MRRLEKEELLHKGTITQRYELDLSESNKRWLLQHLPKYDMQVGAVITEGEGSPYKAGGTAPKK